MTIRQQGGVFGRNPTFNDVTIDGAINAPTTGSTGLVISGGTQSGTANALAGELRLGGNPVYQGRIYYDYNTGDFFIENSYNNNNGEIVFRTKTNSTPVEVGRFNQNGLAFPNGSGIDFSATSGTGTSELFSDYEEGTWTPAIEIYGTPGTYTATTSGIYTKVGNLVTVTGRLINVTESVAGGADYFKITGLPFTDIAGYASVGSVSLGNWNVPACYNAFVTFDSTGARDYIIMGLNVDNGATDYLDKTHLVSGTSDIEFTLSYFT